MIGDITAKILAQSAPPSDSVEITVVEGIKLKFKILVDMDERLRVEQEVSKWAKDMQKTVQGKKLLPDWQEYATDNIVILAQAKLLAILSLEEEFKSELAWLKIAKKAAPVFAGTVAALDELAANKTSDYAVYLDEKKDLSVTKTTLSNAE